MVIRFFFLASICCLNISCGETKTIGPVGPADSSVGSGTVDDGDDTPCRSSNLSLMAIFNCAGDRILDSLANGEAVAWLILDRSKASHRQWNGVGKYGGCTATLLNVGGSGSDPAYIVTNGHCVSLDPEGVIFDNTSLANKTMQFDYFVAEVKARDTYTVSDKKVVFSSMQYTDVAIIELDVTYDHLVELGYNSYKLASLRPQQGTKVTLVGIPADGIDDLGLRKADCSIGTTVSVQEDVYRFSTSSRHGCSIVKGSSGSSLINLSTKEIVAVNNTGVSGAATGAKGCDLDVPCEVASDGSTSVHPEQNYAQSTHFLAGCFVSGRWDRTLTSCKATLYTSSSANQ